VPARCGKIFVVVLLVLTTGLHWTALQTVAWASMLAANLRTHSVSQAVSDTFDGQHLCPLCRAIAAAKKAEKKSEAGAPVLKMEFPPAAERFALISPKRIPAFTLADLPAISLFFKPPVPPPRGFPV
jgi:hypothetical protein